MQLIKQKSSDTLTVVTLSCARLKPANRSQFSNLAVPIDMIPDRGTLLITYLNINLLF